MKNNFPKRIGVIGLGYVGLPVALAMANKFDVVGFDISLDKVECIRRGSDPTKEGLDSQIQNSSMAVTSKKEDLQSCDFFIVCVPTPIDENRTPDLTALYGACATVGEVLKKGDIVVFESTVFPGLTEEICGPILSENSGLVCGVDFALGYSPERINPGDTVHTFETIVKVVSGQTQQALEIIAATYGSVVTAGVFKAASIKVAEAAKVIENTQRDLNIALMNELALIFERMDICTQDVLAAASTKWNFLPFKPGLVGGHCIGVDPYYLTTKAQQLGYHPQVILAGRRINDEMGTYVAQHTIKQLITSDIQPRGARIGILGLTFKENVSDVRNSRVPDIERELKKFGASVFVYDPMVDKEEAWHEYRIELADSSDFNQLDALILAVPHEEFLKGSFVALRKMIKENGVFVDIKGVFHGQAVEGVNYWSL